MGLRRRKSLKNNILLAISSIEGAIILRSDVSAYGEARQISRVLKFLVEDGQLIKLGYGVYVKAEKTVYSSSPIMIVPIAEAYMEALDRLGIRWQLGEVIQNYNSGKTQQVPAKFIVRLKDRFRGRLGVSGRELVFERGVNAR